MKNKILRVLDLFSGCGGLSYGFEQAGFNVVAGVDNWKDALKTFKKNHKNSVTKLIDLGNFSNRDLDSIATNIDVIIGGPPCQGFSISGKRDPNDPRNKLYRGFVQTVEHFQPSAFVMENVPNLISMESGKIKDMIMKNFSDLGYEVSYQILLSSDYGVPQNRRRVVFVGTKKNTPYKFPEGKYSESENKLTCHQALSDLPEETIEDGLKNTTPPASSYQKLMRKKTNKIYNHLITNHSQKTIEIISLVPDGGNYKNLPTHLQSTRKVNIAWTRYNSKKPSLTIDTGHRHHFHYKWNRVPTVRESARLQSFPDNFIFLGSKTSQYKQVGNAVPPLLAKAIASELKKILLNR
ncbi:MAG: DNA cytosine methyltransferase [Candidatus Jacksonbacteria bacterium]|jgi:DNA (cytosine-5)-methyltransferase 1|nr:DNA cytosine methyltransferase [Candidatus Jacksonbacteria bacterium]MBT7008271.1 DNA cytosine methyltransferase [Candidatus Jacksonbacteria bacterium]